MLVIKAIASQPQFYHKRVGIQPSKHYRFIVYCMINGNSPSYSSYKVYILYILY